jgi:PAS domain S-box-containing protein
MKSKDMCILVVDDQEDKRKELIEGLIKSGLPAEKLVEAASGEEAEKLVQNQPGFFDVAVIDQQLEPGRIDGIETTRRICSYERDIFPIIFTNIPSDNPGTIEFSRAKAYEAGAYRYMYRGGGEAAAIKVKDFAAEIRQLSQLSERIGKFYDAQRYAPSLLTQLDIMVSLIDRGYKVWYMNAANKRFQNLKELPRGDCSTVFLKTGGPPPCRGCVVHETFRDGKNHERFYLHPLDRDAHKIQWVYSWTQPMLDENGAPILLEDGRPIAVLESFQDLTDSERLKTMPLKERMNHIARALHERRDGFDRVTIYEANPGGSRLTLVGSFGYPGKIESALIEVSDFPVLQHSIRHFKRTGEGKVRNIPGNEDPVYQGELLENFIHWPLMKGKRLVGLLSVSSVKGGRRCTDDRLDILPGYAEEALKALESMHQESALPGIENILSGIDNLIIQKRTPESRLQALIEEAGRLTDSDSVTIRYRDGEVARLLPLGKGKCYETAPRELRLDARTFSSVRTIISGREEIIGNATKDPRVMEFRQSLPIKSAKALENIDSFCYEPLIFQDRCIGRLGLYKKESHHYTDKYLAMARAISGRLALALHDYLVNIERMIKDYAFESSINGFVFTDLDGNINYVNTSFLQLLGYETQDEVLHKHFRDFIADPKEAVKLVRTLIIEKRGWGGEMLARKKDNSCFYAQLSASLVRDNTGNPIGGIVSFIDITQRKQLEKVQEAIYRISETAGYAQNLDELFPKIHEIIGDFIPAKNFYIALYNEENETICFSYFVDRLDTTPEPRKKKKGLTEYVLRTGQPLLAPPEVYKELNRLGEIEIIGTPSIDWLGVPLKTTDNKTIGVLVVQVYEEGPRYTEKHKDMLVFVSTQIAMAIQRKQAEDRIKASLKEKEALLKEIHHRVKNNLAIVSEFFELRTGDIQEPGFIDFLSGCKNRVKSMALIHETLYQSEDITRIDSKEYIDRLGDNLTLAFAGGPCSIHLEIQVENIPLSIDAAIPCGLIINELVTNAFKHAFSGRRDGEIRIKLQTFADHRVALEISDNGTGIPPNLDIRETSSVGLQLVDILARQLKASVSIQRNQGTQFTIIFPRPIAA